MFLVLLVQSFCSVYRGQLTEVWSWAVPTVLPTLSLIVSVLGADAITARDVLSDERSKVFVVRKSFCMLVFWLSVIYFMLLLGTIFVMPFFLYSNSPEIVSPDEIMNSVNSGKVEPGYQMRPVDVLKISNLWLSPFQSLVIAAMGILFFTKRIV